MAYDAVPVMQLPASNYRAIGEFMFRYSQLEGQLHEIVWHSLRLGYKTGRIVTIGTDSKVLCGMIGTITSSRMWITDSKLADEMSAISKIVHDFNEDRNLIAHGSWQAPASKPKGPAKLVKTKKRSERILPRASGTMTAVNIRAKCKELRKANLRARKLLKTFSRKLGLPYPIFA
jgi:hypothetical protein